MKKTNLLLICLFFISINATSQFSLKKLTNKLSKKTEKKQTTTKKSKATSGRTTAVFSNQGREWYVSKTTGRGQQGTKERPAKDLGNIIHHLKPNDIIYIAEGTYLSKGKRGSDEINVPVKIYGGYDTAFTTRDPWDTHKTIFTGVNEYMKLTTPRLYIRTDQQREKNGQLSEGSTIVVDGIIFDNGPRNRYHKDKNLAIRRQASPKSGQNPSPESGGIVIVGSKFTNIAVQNCVVMNTAPTEGAISVRVFKGGKGIIQNNFCFNNTGYGIQIRSGYMGSDESLYPKFIVKNNTSLFSWKHDAIASYGGSALAIDQSLFATIENNVFGFGHMGGVYNKGAKIVLSSNLFTGNSKYDYKEVNAMMAAEDILDESTKVDFNSLDNEAASIKIPVAERWAKIYAGRDIVSRADVDAAVSVANTGANQLRSIFGLNLQGSTVKMDAEIFLPLVTVDEALPAGQFPWNGKGCTIPKSK
ncbi:MAG TPA: right-handed parallel beta-helix repeat-containing protein [Lutibacter sp.]|nr:right-handed parallel beta-helix repeat-containing protein [Lutibacter sp.]